MTSEQTFQNHLLATLPRSGLDRLRRHLEPVSLSIGEVLETPDEPIAHIFFPLSAISSVVAGSGADRVEVGMIGREGMTGISVVLGGESSPHECFIQTPGEGLRITVPEFNQALEAEPVLWKPFLLNARSYMLQTAQTALANRRCTIEQRLARWLLMSRDRLDRDDILLTHDFLALMLGVRRSGVTMALQALEAANLIKNTRGCITICNRPGLEEIAGPAYSAPAESPNIAGADANKNLENTRGDQKSALTHKLRLRVEQLRNTLEQLHRTTEALDRSNVLIREFRHHYKNDQQRITSLLRHIRNQASEHLSSDLLHALEQMEKGMSADALFSECETDSKEAWPYLEEIAKDAFALHRSGPVTLSCQIEPLLLSGPDLQILGMALNELITNALQHAFVSEAGQISVCLNRQDPDSVELIVRDDGAGIAADINGHPEHGTGLVGALVRQLHGTFSIEPHPIKGTVARIAFQAVVRPSQAASALASAGDRLP